MLELPIIRDAIGKAQADGVDWGKSFVNDDRWNGDCDRMCDHAIREAMIWSAGQGAVTSVGGAATIVPGLAADLSLFLYSQIKLAAALFTIHGIDVRDEEVRPLLLAAAAGIAVTDLIDIIGVKVAQNAVRRTLMSIPGKTLAQINRILGVRLISKAGQKTMTNMVKLVPIVGAVAGGGVNAAMMGASGKLIQKFIADYKSAQLS